MLKRVIILFLAGLILCGGLFLLAGEDIAVTGLKDLLAFITPFDRPDSIILIDGSEQAVKNGKDGLREIPSSVAGLAFEITAEAYNDYARLEAIYDWVTHNIEYDLEKLKDMQAYGSGAEYVLGTRKGVCHDYALLTEALLLAVGIEATYESGEVYPSPGETELHAWNHALVDGAWYALDTTWGAGIILAEEQRFVSRPRRLYLTTPEELRRLHSDPAYREERELEYSRIQSAAAVAEYLPGYEQKLLALFNAHRASAGLAHLAEETRLTETARQAAARFAEAAVNNADYSLDTLNNELERRARELRIKSAAIGAFRQWSTYSGPAEELYHHIVVSQADYLENAVYHSISVGVVRKGDFTVVVCIYLEHY